MGCLLWIFEEVNIIPFKSFLDLKCCKLVIFAFTTLNKARSSPFIKVNILPANVLTILRAKGHLPLISNIASQLHQMSCVLLKLLETLLLVQFKRLFSLQLRIHTSSVLLALCQGESTPDWWILSSTCLYSEKDYHVMASSCTDPVYQRYDLGQVL